jgi:MoxR-like ATPase
LYSCDDCGRDDFATAGILETHKVGYCPARQSQPAVEIEEDHSEKVLVGRLEVPKADPNYYISDADLDEARRVIALAEQEPQNLGIKGPAGSGKSSMALQIAAYRASPTYLANAYTMQSSDQWFGREWVDIKKGGMFYDPSLFVEAIETEGATVIINDINLMQNKSVQNGLNDILDPTLRHAWIDQIARSLGRPVQVAPKVLIIGTWNEGVEYTGTIKLAQNILDRFVNMMYMTYPDDETQKQVIIRKTGVPYANAERLVRYGASLRELDEPVEVSMRKLLMAAAKMQVGAHFRDSLYYTVISGLSVEQQEKALAALETLYSPSEKEAIATRPNDYEAWADRGLNGSVMKS